MALTATYDANNNRLTLDDPVGQSTFTYDVLNRLVGPTQSVDCDIVFANGDFIQWPGNIRKAEIR